MEWKGLQRGRNWEILIYSNTMNMVRLPERVVEAEKVGCFDGLVGLCCIFPPSFLWNILKLKYQDAHLLKNSSDVLKSLTGRAGKLEAGAPLHAYLHTRSFTPASEARPFPDLLGQAFCYAPYRKNQQQFFPRGIP